MNQAAAFPQPTAAHQTQTQEAVPDVVVSFKGITKTFGQFVAVSDISFDVPRGSVVGLLGPNGAGKTTLMRMLLGLADATSGTAEVLGASIKGPYGSQVLRRVGSIIEGPSLYKRLSARQNLQIQADMLGLANPSARIDEMLHLVELADRADDKTAGYSLGMKQRLGIAIALLNQPDVVVLDEPANGLDPAGIVEMRNLLRRLPAMGTTVLVSSHQLHEVQAACDDLVIINHGRMVTRGTTDQLLAQAGTGGVTYQVTVEPAQVEGTVAVLAALGHTQSDPIGIVTVTAAELSPAGITKALADAGVYISGLWPVTQSLEQVFLNLTQTSGYRTS